MERLVRDDEGEKAVVSCRKRTIEATEEIATLQKL